ncbi:MAG: hypothetical protein ACWGQW_22785, partial [bacterium]
MKRITRGEFLGIGAGLAAGAGFIGCSKEMQGESSTAGPDLILLNGLVYTMDPNLPVAEAFAVKAGRLIAVGSSDDIKHLSHAQSEVID